jgi:uncharacterized protein YaiL (DUF2058 family)
MLRACFISQDDGRLLTLPGVGPSSLAQQRSSEGKSKSSKEAKKDRGKSKEKHSRKKDKRGKGERKDRKGSNIEKLRQERLRREQAERERARQAIMGNINAQERPGDKKYNAAYGNVAPSRTSTVA